MTIINFRFWKLSLTERILIMNRTHVNQRKVESNQSRWSSSREYFLPLRDGKTTRVCKSMFLSTLGLKSDAMIVELAPAQSRSYADAVASIEDRRGKHPASHKCDTKATHRRINSYNPSISHCKCKNAPNKRYLNPKMSIKSMYEQFLQHKENMVITCRTYCHAFLAEIIGFSRPTQDEI